MERDVKWLVLNDNYLDFLRELEPRIPNTSYGTNKYKPFFGSLFETDNFKYVTQVSSAKDRHLGMTENIDFYKIYDPRNTTRLISVVNLNFMFPVPKFEVTIIDNYKIIDTLKTFSDEIARSKYIRLLKTELSEINKKDLKTSALDIYETKAMKPNSNLSKRCFDFKELENRANKWIDLYKEL